jgi:hypothetical protein
MNPKRKGNRNENKEARLLSKWMFGDNKTLYRHENSGARKDVYTGDIIPKDVDSFEWKIFPFVFEAKHGYKDSLPTLMNYKIVNDWIVKLLSERTDSQRIPVIIARFHHRRAVLFTNIDLNFQPELTLYIQYNDTIESFHQYDYNSLICRNFYYIMPDWFPEVIGMDPIMGQRKINKSSPFVPNRQLTHIEKKKGNQVLVPDVPVDPEVPLTPAQVSEKREFLFDVIGEIYPRHRGGNK